MCTLSSNSLNTMFSSSTKPTTTSSSSSEKNVVAKKRKSCKKCSHEGCTNNAKSRGLCKRHGGGMRCQAKGCGTSARPGGYCITHGGGLCKIAGCTTGARSGGLCLMHQRIGEMREKRAAKLIGLSGPTPLKNSSNSTLSSHGQEVATVEMNAIQETSSVLSDYTSTSSCSTLDPSVTEQLDFYDSGVLEPFPLYIKTEQRRMDSIHHWHPENQEDPPAYSHLPVFEPCGTIDYSFHVNHPSDYFFQGNNLHLPESQLDDILNELQAYRGTLLPKVYDNNEYYYPNNLEDNLEKLVALQPYPIVYNNQQNNNNNSNLLFR